jgi:hypothetical protein
MSTIFLKIIKHFKKSQSFQWKDFFELLGTYIITESKEKYLQNLKHYQQFLSQIYSIIF